MTKMNWDRSLPSNRYITRTQKKPKPFIAPTPKQIAYMKVLGIPYTEGMSRNDCSSLISYAKEHADSNR
jgi:hypothetical protein